MPRLARFIGSLQTTQKYAIESPQCQSMQSNLAIQLLCVRMRCCRARKSEGRDARDSLRKQVNSMSEYHLMGDAKQLLRRAFSLFLKGEGIEIGALHQPMRLEGLPVTRIQYVDRIPLAALREHYPELTGYKFVPVDVIDDGEILSSFSANSLDFVIANHFIEHTSNPIGTLRNWQLKLRQGGVIFMAIPDMRFTFDSSRPMTTLEHLASDDTLLPSERERADQKHYLEYASLVNNQRGDDVAPHATFLKSVGYSIHYHTFIPESYRRMLEYIIADLHLPLKISAFVETLPSNDEFLVVLSKI